MAKTLTIRKGCKVRYVKTHYNLWGNPISTTNEVVTITDNPRDPETGRYCSAQDWHAYVKVRNGKGTEYEAECDDLEVYNTMGDLTHDDYMQLRREIRHGSIYLSDYRNSFGVDENEVYSASEGFGMETGWNDDEDTPEAFADYCDAIEYEAA